MKSNNLLLKYPDLIEKCRLWDCSYEEAIEKIKEKENKKGLLRFIE